MFVMYKDNAGDECIYQSDSMEGLIECMKANSQTPIRTYTIYSDPRFDSDVLGYITFYGETFVGTLNYSVAISR